MILGMIVIPIGVAADCAVRCVEQVLVMVLSIFIVMNIDSIIRFIKATHSDFHFSHKVQTK